MTVLQFHDPIDWNSETAKQVETIYFNLIFAELATIEKCYPLSTLYQMKLRGYAGKHQKLHTRKESKG